MGYDAPLHLLGGPRLGWSQAHNQLPMVIMWLAEQGQMSLHSLGWRASARMREAQELCRCGESADGGGAGHSTVRRVLHAWRARWRAGGGRVGAAGVVFTNAAAPGSHSDGGARAAAAAAIGCVAVP